MKGFFPNANASLFSSSRESTTIIWTWSTVSLAAALLIDHFHQDLAILPQRHLQVASWNRGIRNIANCIPFYVLVTWSVDVETTWSIPLKYWWARILERSAKAVPSRCSSLGIIFTKEATIYSSSSTVPFLPFLRSCFLDLFVFVLKHHGAVSQFHINEIR